MSMNAFEHIQKFSWGWFVFGYAIVALLIYGDLAGTSEQSGTLWVGFAVGALLFAVQMARLSITIDAEGIGYRWKPYQKKNSVFAKSEINSLTITRYPFIGYGYRVSAKYGTVLNTRGAIGLWLTTKRGESYLLGISDVKGVREALKKYGYEVSTSDN